MIAWALLYATLAGTAAQQPGPAPPTARPEPAPIRRVFVDRLTGGDSAAQIRDLLIAALQKTSLFTVTENEQRADAFLRGAADDVVFTDTFSSSESVDASASLGGRSSSSRSRSPGASVGDRESVDIRERKHEALATVRLVSKDGDVLWSTTQESRGGKHRGAGADVADKVARQLTADWQRVLANSK